MERFARFVTRRGAETRPADPALLLRAWEAQERARSRRSARSGASIGRAQAAPLPDARQREQARAAGAGAAADRVPGSAAARWAERG